jgi:hypothetical protein
VIGTRPRGRKAMKRRVNPPAPYHHRIGSLGVSAVRDMCFGRTSYRPHLITEGGIPEGVTNRPTWSTPPRFPFLKCAACETVASPEPMA